MTAALEAVQDAKEAGLRYVTDETPGIARRKSGSGFRYLGPDGESIRDPKQLARIEKLAIPPAWTEVWICPSSRGHLQATGRDAKGRKQYRYHEKWRETRDETKFAAGEDFDITRPNAREHLSFGFGIHYCLGNMLAKLQAKIALEEVARLAPRLQLDAPEDIAFRENLSFRVPETVPVTWKA